MWRLDTNVNTLTSMLCALYCPTDRAVPCYAVLCYAGAASYLTDSESSDAESSEEEEHEMNRVVFVSSPEPAWMNRDWRKRLWHARYELCCTAQQASCACQRIPHLACFCRLWAGHQAVPLSPRLAHTPGCCRFSTAGVASCTDEPCLLVLLVGMIDPLRDSCCWLQTHHG